MDTNLEHRISLMKKIQQVSGIVVGRNEQGQHAKFASLEQINDAVDAKLKEIGLFVHCMPTTQYSEGNAFVGIEVEVIDLETGYSKKSVVTAPVRMYRMDSKTGVPIEQETIFMEGGKNLTYFERYAKRVVLGLVTDDDPEKVTDRQPVLITANMVLAHGYASNDKEAKMLMKDLALDGKSEAFGMSVLAEYKRRFEAAADGIDGQGELEELHKMVCEQILVDLAKKAAK